MDIELLKKLELDNLIMFDELCKEHNLKYSLAYGTLIGAIRHNGFIPWDDDIDVIMPRDDYEKLLKLNFDNDNFKICNYKDDKDYFYGFAKMINKSKKLYEDYRPEKCLGPYIDIFPFDYLPNDEKIRNRIMKKVVKSNRKTYFITTSSKSVYKADGISFLKLMLIRFVTYFISNKAKKRYLYKLERNATKNEKSKYIGNQLFTKMIDDYMPADNFDHLINVNFEGHNFMCIENFDKLLRRQYGDYMKLPPEEERHPKHSFIMK